MKVDLTGNRAEHDRNFAATGDYMKRGFTIHGSGRR